MRNIIAIISLLSMLSIANAQETEDYSPFVEQGKEWLLWDLVYSPTNRKTYKMVGDTIVDGKQCVKWMQEKPLGDISYWFYVCAYEENKKVWFFYEDEDIPRLFFDFGVQVGDTLHDCYIPHAWWYHDLKNRGWDNPADELLKTSIIITKRDSIVYGERLQRCLFFKYKDHNTSCYLDNISRACMMEGVGCLYQGPTALGEFAIEYNGDGLIYCLVNDTALYFNTDIAKALNIPIPTSVTPPQMANGKWSICNGQYFDLTGRRLAAPPAKGLYIENGQVKINK